jgi:hypothetical protein
MKIKLIIIATLLLGLLAFPGCVKRQLDPAGVYQGDSYLFQTELSINTSYEVIHTFVKWEKDNRDILRQWPEVKKAADRMRAGAPDWFKTANAAHDAYKVNPGDQTKSELELSVAILRTALLEATRYMTRTATPTP